MTEEMVGITATEKHPRESIEVEVETPSYEWLQGCRDTASLVEHFVDAHTRQSGSAVIPVADLRRFLSRLIDRTDELVLPHTKVRLLLDVGADVGEQDSIVC